LSRSWATGILENLDDCIDHFTEVVRGDVRGHSYGDADRTIDQQVRITRRQHHRLLRVPVVVGPEVDRVLADVAQQLHGDAG